MEVGSHQRKSSYLHDAKSSRTPGHSNSREPPPQDRVAARPDEDCSVGGKEPLRSSVTSNSKYVDSPRVDACATRLFRLTQPTLHKRAESKAKTQRGKQHRLTSQLRDVLIFVFLDENPQDIHERGERMTFIFPHFVRDAIEQLGQFPVIRFRMRDPDRVRNRRPSLGHSLQISGGHIIVSLSEAKLYRKVNLRQKEELGRRNRTSASPLLSIFFDDFLVLPLLRRLRARTEVLLVILRRRRFLRRTG